MTVIASVASGAPGAPAVTAAPLLTIDGIDVAYGETQVLFDVSLHIAPGEVVCLLGPSGAGKTTTLRAALGLTPARRGRIAFAGADITAAATHRIARAGISWVPEERRVCPSLSVAQNLALGRKRTAFRAWTEAEVIGIFPALDHLRDRDCENLSGGELQMVAIGRALLGAPGLVLFDEPSQGLAPKIVRDVLAVIRRLQDAGVASLVVEQNAVSALGVADRCYVLRGGRIVHHGPARALLDDVALRTRLLGGLS